jgi:exodeoxyribonuclease VII small subunit
MMSELKFEDELQALEKCSENIMREGASLDESLHAYEVGMKHYKACKAVLENAEQRIKLIDVSEELDCGSSPQ